MSVHRIKKGLDIPIAGAPEQSISTAQPPKHVAVMAADYIGMKPVMAVSLGDGVKRGQLLFEDRKTPGVRYTAPGAGKIAAINRGARRALQSVVIELNENERAGNLTDADEAPFESYTGKSIAALARDEIQALLVESGLWTAFRTRPFSRVPSPETKPHAIFVTAIDTNPLAPSVEKILEGQEEAFNAGVMALVKLTDGEVYVCKKTGSAIQVNPNSGTTVEEFEGPHPAGNAGLHIHLIDPVHREKTVWQIDCQEVVAIGQLLATGKLPVERVVALAGPSVKKPRLLKTRLGASTDDLAEGELEDAENRVISGSVLAGREAKGPILGYLGRYHHQVSVIQEGRSRAFLGWMAPGVNDYSVTNTFMSALSRGKKLFRFTSSQYGGHRAMVPIGLYERVMPMDILPTFLLRALLSDDLERAEELGCLELDEEDVALCTFVCPCKIDYGPVLRKCLTEIEKEG